MAMTETTTHTELVTAKFIPEVYSKKVQMFLEDNLVAAKVCNTDFKEDLYTGYICNIPFIKEVAATSVVPGAQSTGVDAQGTPKAVTVDQWQEAVVSCSERSAIQANPKYLENAAKQIGYSLAKVIDTAVCTLFSTLNGDSVLGADGTEVTSDVLLTAKETLDEHSVPRENRVLVIDPATENDLIKLDIFANKDFGATKVIKDGRLEKIYGCEVFVTNNLVAASTGSYAVMMHRDAIALIIQKNPDIFIDNTRLLAMKAVIGRVLYGCAELRDGSGVPFYTRKA